MMRTARARYGLAVASRALYSMLLGSPCASVHTRSGASLLFMPHTLRIAGSSEPCSLPCSPLIGKPSELLHSLRNPR